MASVESPSESLQGAGFMTNSIFALGREAPDIRTAKKPAYLASLARHALMRNSFKSIFLSNRLYLGQTKLLRFRLMSFVKVALDKEIYDLETP